VGLRRVSVGSLVNPGTTITSLDDTSTIKVDFSVPENYLASLRQGLSVYVTSTAFPERDFEGKVASVDSRVDPVTRSVTVRALLPNADGALKPGMFLSVRLDRDSHEALMIPEAALVPEQSRQFIYVVEDGRAVRREVRIGRREPGKVEVVAGLKAGDQVIVEGTQKVREGGAVRELERPAVSDTAEARR
jgi:membrane fusion protein (multidrug efflux system)